MVQENRGAKPAPLHDMVCLYPSLPLPFSFDPEFGLQEISQDSNLTCLTDAFSQESHCQIFKKVYPGASQGKNTAKVTSQVIYMLEPAKNVITSDALESDKELKKRQLNFSYEGIIKKRWMDYNLDLETASVMEAGILKEWLRVMALK